MGVEYFSLIWLSLTLLEAYRNGHVTSDKMTSNWVENFHQKLTEDIGFEHHGQLSLSSAEVLFRTTVSSSSQQPQNQLLLSGGLAGSVNRDVSNVFMASFPQLDTDFRPLFVKIIWQGFAAWVCTGLVNCSTFSIEINRCHIHRLSYSNYSASMLMESTMPNMTQFRVLKCADVPFIFVSWQTKYLSNVGWTKPTIC